MNEWTNNSNDSSSPSKLNEQTTKLVAEWLNKLTELRTEKWKSPVESYKISKLASNSIEN